MEIFNKNFFRFLSGFAGMVLVGLFVVFVASFYENRVIVNGKQKNSEASLPVKPVVENGRNSGAVGAIDSQAASASSTFRF